MRQTDLKLHMFVFFLGVCLYTVTGIVLHSTHAVPTIFNDCPGLWESMTLILSLKCIRMTLCAIALHKMDVRARVTDCFHMFIHTVYFVTSCVVTSVSLNSSVCVYAMGLPFGGNPMIAYVNGVACAWDGCVVLSIALYTVIDRTR